MYISKIYVIYMFPNLIELIIVINADFEEKGTTTQSYMPMATRLVYFSHIKTSFLSLCVL